MAVKVSKLFKDYKFQKLSLSARYLYIYLVTNPDLSQIGVFSPDLRVVALEVGLDMDGLRKFSSELIKNGYIFVRKFDDLIYYIVPSQFNSLPNSDNTSKKVTKLLSDLPKDLVAFLDSLGIKPSSKVVEFKKPTPEEVTKYAMSLGYNIDGNKFIEYYDSTSTGKKHWVDGRGKQIRDWKRKLRIVWCKEDRKLKSVPNAPKGFEHFHVVVGGVIYYPDKWVDGKPSSTDFIKKKALLKEFNRLSDGK